MSTSFEHWLDDRTVIGAKFRQVDESFSHDFGVEYRKGWEMVDDSFYVMIFIAPNNFEHTVKFVSEKDEDHFKEFLTEEFNRQLSEAG